MCQKITKITPGFAYFARVAKAKVLPISINGGAGKRPKIFSGKITIKIGKIIEPSKDLSITMKNWCDSIVALGDYELTDSAKEILEKSKVKEEKHESVNTES